MNKPIIGILAKHMEIKNKFNNTFVRDEIKDAIYSNGGIAIALLPTNSNIILVDNNNEEEMSKNLNNILTKKEKENLIAQIKLCDGIVIAGGYTNDVYEMWVARYCYKNNIPLLATCAGHNNMIRALGGKTKLVSNPDFHNQKEKQYVHNVQINKNSNFYKIVKTTKFAVNSRHIYTLKDALMLDVVGVDEDGNIEITEAKNKKFFVGVCFHPESLYKIDKNHNAIFMAFIKACK
ncbi:MAG: gamma-glutamyl-gamma-aminobutyrate hydrolase family protein [Clostridia bacterium]|nr:gamma-glutamyl-gamma-aminobutyrate hydrolase family protein [Clostridia bacterium]